MVYNRSDCLSNALEQLLLDGSARSRHAPHFPRNDESISKRKGNVERLRPGMLGRLGFASATMFRFSDDREMGATVKVKIPATKLGLMERPNACVMLSLRFSPGFGVAAKDDGACWFGKRLGLVLWFMVPSCIILLLNVLLTILLYIIFLRL